MHSGEFPTDKPALRKMLRAKRKSASHAGPFIFAPQAETQLMAMLSDCNVVASYAAMGGEADPLAINRALYAQGKTIALPVIGDDDETLTFHRWTPDSVMEEGSFAIPIPQTLSAPLIPDAFLVPLLGFDRACNRLGQGKGHYDRCFEVYPDALRIGIAWAVQELPAVPTDPWDVPLHAIASDKDWFTR
jgi:5-formyltetrahydrofolate cyclo-ligase